MKYNEMKANLEEMVKTNYEDFIKALVSVEKGVDDKKALDTIFEQYMNNDSMSLLDENFDCIIEDLREQGMINEKQNDNLVNVVGNVVKDPEIHERNGSNGAFRVANLTVVNKDGEGNKHYHNIQVNGDKVNKVDKLKQGDFIKVFGEVSSYTDKEGKEKPFIKLYKATMLKARENINENKKEPREDEKKPSTLGMLKQFQSDVKK